LSHFAQKIDDITFKAACKNKSGAQKKIYELYSKSVYNLVFRITHNQADSLDISQDIFVKVFTNLSQNKSQELLGFWIRRISINTTLSFIKKNSHLITNVDFKEKIIDTDYNETMSSLEFALSKLSAISRSVLWLYEVEGLSHQEIAEFHGKTISFSKTHLSRAKQKAQEVLTKKGGGYEAIK
jgi:RNA polymerase sigma-70 factor (ECF subfamily)